ncbi:MAG: alpha/beta hydrolase [Bacteroidota bacterium]
MNLPAYWKACRHARARMNVHEERVPYGPHRRQYAVVVRSREMPATDSRKIAFYFHGGAWTFGRPETFVPAAIPWLAEGFTVVLPSYRRPPEVGLNRVVADCRAAITHFRPEGAVSALHLGGMSAGAHLAGLLGANPEYWTSAGWVTPPQRVLCCAGPLSFAAGGATRALLPYYAHLDAIRALRAAGPNPARWLLLHGTADPVVVTRHSRRFYARLRELGHPARLELLPGGSHLDAGRWMFGDPTTERVTDFLRSNNN